LIAELKEERPVDMDYNNCEHESGNLIGKCAICGEMICEDCYRSVYNQMMCGAHRDLEDESTWELAGSYHTNDPIDEVKFALGEHGVAALFVEVDTDTVELYVPEEDKESVWEMFKASSDADRLCHECKINFSDQVTLCPVCGKAPGGS